jgi:hypothetical protein
MSGNRHRTTLETIGEVLAYGSFVVCLRLVSKLSETSPDDASSVTSFESGSEMCCDVDNIAKQAEMTEESLCLEYICRSSPQPATPPASPLALIPALLSGGQEEMPCSIS